MEVIQNTAVICACVPSKITFEHIHPEMEQPRFIIGMRIQSGVSSGLSIGFDTIVTIHGVKADLDNAADAKPGPSL